MVDQIPQVEIGNGGKDQDQEEESGGFPVKKETGSKKEGIPDCPLPVNPRNRSAVPPVEAPEKEPGEDQWLLRVKKKYVSQYLAQDLHFLVDTR